MTVGWSEHRDGGEAARLGTAGPTVRELEGIERGTASRQAPSSWPGDLAPAAQRGSWSLVRGGRAPAVEA
jgi:hypothetical protein